MKILRHWWNIRYGNNIWETNPTKGKNLLTTIFKHTMGIYTHIDDVVSRDKHAICNWALLPLCVMLWRRRKHALTGCHCHLLAPNLEATNDAGRWNSKQL